LGDHPTDDYTQRKSGDYVRGIVDACQHSCEAKRARGEHKQTAQPASIPDEASGQSGRNDHVLRWKGGVSAMWDKEVYIVSLREGPWMVIEVLDEGDGCEAD